MKKSKKIISIITAVFMLMTVFVVPVGPVYAEEGKDDNDIAWTEGVTGGAIYFDEETGTITDCDYEVTEAVIPEEINGVKVMYIGVRAFAGVGIESVTFPTGLKKIKRDAFYMCQYITEILCPLGLEEIDTWAFADCTNLKDITFNSDLKKVNNYAFHGCNSLESVFIPESVEIIGEGAFVQTQQFDDYLRAGSLKYIEVDDNNKNYCSEDGVLYSEDKKKLILYPKCKTGNYFNIPEGVEVIEDYAFAGCRLYNINFPETIRKIGCGSFAELWNVEELRFKEGLREIGVYAFEGNPYQSVKKIILPKSVEYIEDEVFKYGQEIIGYSGSYAETYAKENNIPFVALDSINDSVQIKKELDKNVDVLYNPSRGDENKTISVRYKDRYFIEDNRQYNLGLAKVSLAATMASMTTKLDSNGNKIEKENCNLNIKHMLVEELEFDNYIPYNYEIPLTDTTDKVAFSIASKTVLLNGKEETIIAIVIRSGDYGGEWASNGRVEGGYEGSLHSGFSSAALKVVEKVKLYMEANGMDTSATRIWITGFSRGAAVSNLLAKKMIEVGLVNDSNLYCYTFATPKTTQKPQKIRGIFNTINPIDLVTEVPLGEWNYGYFGSNVYLPSKFNESYSSDLSTTKIEFKNITGEMYQPYINHMSFLKLLINALNNVVGGSEETYYKNYQQDVSALLGKYLGKADEEPNIVALLCKLGIDLSSTKTSFSLRAALVSGEGPVIDMLANGMASQAMKQHWPETYMAWLNTGSIYTHASKKEVKVKCPVNVSIYDEQNQIVAQIVDDNAIDFIKKNQDIALEAYVDENGEKNIIIPNDGEYKIEIIAVDDGKMNYSVEEYDDEGEIFKKTNYNDIPIEKEAVFEGRLAEGQNVNDGAFDLKNNGEIIEPTEVLEKDELNNIKVEVTIEGRGYVVGGGAYSSGDSVVLTAMPLTTSEFVGWYKNNELISTELDYGFLVSEEEFINIVAKFKSDLNNATITLPYSNYKYTGKQIKPVPTVTINGETLKKDVDYTVSYGINKWPGTGTVNITGMGKYTGTVTKQFTIAKVTGLKVKATGTNYIKLGWNKQANVKGYKVYRLKDGKYKLVKTIKGAKNNSCTIYNLGAGYGYTFKVKSYAGNKPYHSVYSDPLAAPTKPAKVVMTKLTTGKTHFVKAFWKKKTGTGYQVMIATNSKFTKGKNVYKITSNKILSKKIAGLKKGKTYYVKVRAYKTFGGKTQYGQWSKYKSIRGK